MVQDSFAAVPELVDGLVSGTSVFLGVRVQIPSAALHFVIASASEAMTKNRAIYKNVNNKYPASTGLKKCSLGIHA